MTNPATTPATDSIFITFDLGLTNPVEHIMDSMQGYDTDLYRAEITAGRIDDLVDEEWHNVWTQGDNSFATEAAARAHADETDARHVLEITRDDIRAALLRAFGPE